MRVFAFPRPKWRRRRKWIRCWWWKWGKEDYPDDPVEIGKHAEEIASGELEVEGFGSSQPITASA